MVPAVYQSIPLFGSRTSLKAVTSRRARRLLAIRPTYDTARLVPGRNSRSNVKLKTYSVGAWSFESTLCSMRSPSSIGCDKGNWRLPGTTTFGRGRTSWLKPVNRGARGEVLPATESYVFAGVV